MLAIFVAIVLAGIALWGLWALLNMWAAESARRTEADLANRMNEAERRRLWPRPDDAG